MGRSPNSDDSGLKKGPWTPDEDEKLVNYVQKHGHSSWRALPKLAGTAFCVFVLFLKSLMSLIKLNSHVVLYL